MIEYRVIDLRTEARFQQPILVMAFSPEEAANIALGVELVRSGSYLDLRAKVYFNDPGIKSSMVRLFAPLEQLLSN